MSGSPIAATPYEVLGVSPTADAEELRRSYRRMLRETHPDTGGVAVQFHAVQAAWELVGTPEDRAAYDRGSVGSSRGTSGRGTSAAPPPQSWAPSETVNVRGTRPAPREYGLAGAAQRDAYLDMLGQWNPGFAGDPYSPVLVRSAPPELRKVLAKALAEEATAHYLSSLGIGFTIWHGIATKTSAPGEPEQKLDHVVLGANGLFALSSEDWGAPVRTRKGELIGSGLADGELPVNSLSIKAKWLGRISKVPFTATIVVVPDGTSDASVIMLGTMRGLPSLLVQRSRLPDVLRTGLGTPPFRGGAEVFELRTRLSAGIRFL
jgi:curved DNA-binding protein CbpA